MNRYFYFLATLLFITLNFIFLECNESSILITARHYVDPNWIPGDWWLSTGIEYGNLFNFFAGMIYKYSSYVTTFLVGRIILYSLWGYVFVMIFNEFKIIPMLIPLFFCFVQKNQSMGFGEWMIPGFETKAFAYLSFFTALFFMAKHRKKYAAFFMGLSVSFHVLVGLYLSLALIIAVVIDRKVLKQLELRKNDIIKGGITFFLGATFGIIAIIKWMLAAEDIDPSVAEWGSIIYVTKRVSHHVMYSFNLRSVLFIFGFIALSIFYIRKFNCSLFIRILIGTTYASILYFFAGILITKYGQVHHLKFYFFRTPDVLIPITTILLSFALFGYWIQKIKKKNIMRVLLIFLLLAGVSRSFYKCNKGFKAFKLKHDDQKNEAYQWIKKNTHKSDTFLISPSNQQFYVNAERPIYVGFKHSPQKEKHIVEWYKRLMALNGGKEPRETSWWLSFEVNRNFERLQSDYLKALIKDNKIQYVFVKKGVVFDLKTAFANDQYTIYESPNLEQH